MALPKKKFKCFFCDEILPYRTVPLFNLQLQIIKNLLVKAQWLNSFCAESSEKKIMLKHYISRTEKCYESEDRSE